MIMIAIVVVIKKVKRGPQKEELRIKFNCRQQEAINKYKTLKV